MQRPKPYVFFHSELQQNRPKNIQSILSQTYSSGDIKKVELSYHRTPIIQIKPTKTIFTTQTDDMIQRQWSYFRGKVLDGQDDYKQYLTDIIQTKVNRKIKQTSLLFSYDSFNSKANIHTYIDNIPNIVLLCKTAKGYYLAAYSQSPVQNGNQGQGKGFIVSLTNQKCYDLIEDKKAVKYDKLFLIFGNNEIRVSANDKKIFSNFGINNSHFDSKKSRVNELLGQGQSKEAILDHFQVHQLTFK